MTGNTENEDESRAPAMPRAARPVDRNPGDRKPGELAPLDLDFLDLSVERIEERISPGETNVFDK